MRLPSPAPSSGLSPIFGRTEELGRVTEALVSHRLVTLTGAAGFGKTRLARVCADSLRGTSRFGARVWFADLTACRSVDEAVATVAEALGLVLTNQSHSGGGAEQVRSYLAAGETSLLVLDNAEHLVASMSDWLLELVTTVVQVHVLATSREAFGLAGELRMLIGPLGLPDSGRWKESAAVQLFIARANAVGPALDLSDDVLACIGQLVLRLDGNPLAIELAAARSTLFSPTQLLARLDRRFELLSQDQAPKDGLWGAINESWSALSADEQHGLMALSLFRRGASVEAAEAMVEAWTDAGASTLPMNLLGALVRKSLVVTTVSTATPEVRRLDLYESIREFARARLKDSGDEDTALERHRTWFRGLAMRLAQDGRSKAGTATAHEEAAADLENLLDMFDGGLMPDIEASVYEATVDALLATRSLIQGQVPRPVAVRQLSTAMLRADELPAATRVRLTSEYGNALAVDEDHAKRAATAFQAALAEARALGDSCLEGHVLYQSSRMLDFRPPEQAIEALSRAVSLLQGEAHRSTRGRALCALALAYLRRKDYALAEATLEGALAASSGEQRWDVRCMALNNYSLLNALLGRWAESKQQLLEALELAVLTRNTALECVIRGNIGECWLAEGGFSEGQRWMRESQSLAERCGHKRQLGVATGYLAGFAHLRGEVQVAYRGYCEALDALSKGYDDPLAEGLFMAVRSLASAQLGRHGEARRGLVLAQGRIMAVTDPILWSAFQVYRLTAEVVMGSTAAAEGRRTTKRLVSEAEQLALTQPPPHRMHLVGHARTLFEAVVAPAPVVTATKAAPAMPALVLEAGARGIALPTGETIPLGRRPQARRILTLLMQHRIDAPGESVDVQRLFDAGWPGDGVAEPYRSNRVYVTMTRLRQAGLAPYLIHDGEGYMFDPEQHVVMA